MKGAIRVDERQETISPGVWAAGDCCESRHLVTGEPVYVALGTYANKQGRVAGINIGGGHAVFPGVLGTAITEDLRHRDRPHRPGHGRGRARPASTRWRRRIESTTTAGYFPEAAPMTVKLVVERELGQSCSAPRSSVAPARPSASTPAPRPSLPA